MVWSSREGKFFDYNSMEELEEKVRNKISSDINSKKKLKLRDKIGVKNGKNLKHKGRIWEFKEEIEARENMELYLKKEREKVERQIREESEDEEKKRKELVEAKRKQAEKEEEERLKEIERQKRAKVNEIVEKKKKNDEFDIGNIKSDLVEKFGYVFGDEKVSGDAWKSLETVNPEVKYIGVGELKVPKAKNMLGFKVAKTSKRHPKKEDLWNGVFIVSGEDNVKTLLKKIHSKEAVLGEGSIVVEVKSDDVKSNTKGGWKSIENTLCVVGKKRKRPQEDIIDSMLEGDIFENAVGIDETKRTKTQ